ncbi:MAG: flagellar biosynthetic protein FliR [Acidimicrobiales bacterium]|jgi:flagellar biosynthetic protein FliR
MQLDVATESLVTLLLVATRTMATLTVAPPFNAGMVPARIRLGLAVAVGILVAGGPADTATIPIEIPSLVMAIASQIVVGLVFGFFVQLLMAAFQLAGSIIDLSAGLSAGALYDPTTQSQTAPVGRLYQMVSLALLVAVDGHVLVMRGVLRSYEAAPLGGVNSELLGPALVEGASQLLIAALEVGFPVLATLVLTEMALALATRAAPKMNIMAIGFGVKSLVLFFALGVGLPLLANATSNLLEVGLRSGSGLIGG